ncbi:MAG: hypothetical protein KF799_09320 [Bdellovibrionales bacterium]|nr:hypothetical protein [Bdellovibrionales bacterium]
MENTTVQKLESLCSPRRKPATRVGLPSIEDIQRRAGHLKDVALVLKAEFAGLDEQIDQILTLVRPWYVLPQAQRRPTVISLWGMTGVGKSSFVRRMVECLDCMSSFAYLDLGKASEGAASRLSGDSSLPSSMNRLSGQPCVLFFDEMHTVRTVDEGGHDIDRPQLCDFWSLIDSGLITQNMDAIANALNGVLREIRYLPQNMHNLEHAPFADEYQLDHMIGMLELKTSSRDLREIALSDPHGFLNWNVQKLEQLYKNNTPMDFTQALIFTAGNLDEVYGDSFSVNPDDMNAEDLYRRTSQVSPDKVKESLLRRFRPEQVARLGSMQIVFPSLSKNAFLRLIRLRLQGLSSWIKSAFDVSLEFDETIVQMILHEGVVPAQGARPVLSTITELIEIRTSAWLIAASERGVSGLNVRYDRLAQTIECMAGSATLWSARIKTKEERLPQITMNETVRQVIMVHEAGHTVVGIVTQGRLPIKILTGSMAWHRGGPRVEFPPTDTLTRDCAMAMLATSLAGMAAEQVIFGKESFSMGCSSDLQKATSLAASMVSQCGMGSHLGVSFLDQMNPGNLATVKENDDRDVEALLQTALQQARKILLAQRPLLNAIIELLDSSERVTRKDIGESVRRFYRGSKKEIDEILLREHSRTLEVLVPRRLKKVS